MVYHRIKNSPYSSLFAPRLFTSSSTPETMVIDFESLMSATLIIDSKPFFTFRNPFWLDENTQKYLGEVGIKGRS